MKHPLLFVLYALIIFIAFAEGRGVLVNGDSKSAIPNQYIVVFNSDVTVETRDLHVAELRKKFVFNKESAVLEEVINVFHIGSLVGFSARLTSKSLTEEMEHPHVRYIEADQVVTALDDDDDDDDPQTQQGATWGIDRIDQASLPLSGTYTYYESAGEGTKAYVLDTGILLTHDEFDDRAVWGTSMVPNEPNTDENGHGTLVAGIIGGTIYGVAKKVTLVAVKVLNSKGSGAWTAVISGIDWVTQDHTKRGKDARSVVNMSLGGTASPTVDTAVEESVAKGVNYVVAAGGNGDNACYYSPARVPGAITVSATTKLDARDASSNFGTCVDLFAPGESITAAWIGANNNATNTLSGSSMATAHVVGAVAVRLGHLFVAGQIVPPSPVEVQLWIKEVGTKGVLKNVGTGSPNTLLFSPYSDI